MARKSRDRLTAADIMQTDVVTVGPKETLQDAMELMTENHVTGLPVVDHKGRCVGVISATDILNYEQEHAEFTTEANAELARHFDPETNRWESVRVSSYALEEFGEVPVQDVMTRDLVAVGPEAPLNEVARTMIDGEVHRVLVVNQRRELVGLISAFDFVRLFAEEE